MTRISFSMSVLLSVLIASVSFSADDGQDDLDRATQLKLNAKSLRDTEKVIALCESALEKGLDSADKDFAKQLLVGVLWQHASQHIAPILEQQPPDRRWQELRVVAIRDLEKLLQHDDQFRDAYMMLGRLEALPGGDRTKAKMAIDRAIDLSADDPSNRSEALLHRAAMRNDPEARLADLDAAIKIDPTNATGLEMRARFYVGLGEIEKAVKDLQEMLAGDSENIKIHQALAEAFASLDRFDLALDHLGKAIELAPSQTLNYVLRAKVYEQKEDFQNAVDDLSKALELQPDDHRPLLDRARVHYLANDLPKARADVDLALQKNPASGPARLLRSIISEAQQRYRDAITDLELLLSDRPDNLELQLQLARLLMRDDRPRKAIKTLTYIVETDESHWEAFRTRADALLSVGQHAEAIEDYGRALALQPKDDGILNNLAWVLATSPVDELRDGQRSIELATQACELTKFEMPHILSTLAAGYAEAGDFESAIKWSTKAVEKGQTDLKDQVEQLQNELDSYKQGKPWRELQEIKDKPDPPRRIIET